MASVDTLVPRASRATTGASSSIDVAGSTQIRAQLNVTAETDASSTLDVKIQDSLDGSNWNDLFSFAQVTDGSEIEVKNFTNPFARKLRAHWTIAGDDVLTAASYETALTGTDNDLTFTADTAGAAGNDITITYVDPPGNNAALSVDVTGTDIVVNLATDGSSVITSTAADVEAAIEADQDAAALVNVANKSGNDGSGVVTALAETNLAGGIDALDAAFTFDVRVSHK